MNVKPFLMSAVSAHLFVPDLFVQTEFQKSGLNKKIWDKKMRHRQHQNLACADSTIDPQSDA
jgi:hypothetical protein